MKENSQSNFLKLFNKKDPVDRAVMEMLLLSSTINKNSENENSENFIEKYIGELIRKEENVVNLLEVQTFINSRNNSNTLKNSNKISGKFIGDSIFLKMNYNEDEEKSTYYNIERSKIDTNKLKLLLEDAPEDFTIPGLTNDSFSFATIANYDREDEVKEDEVKEDEVKYGKLKDEVKEKDEVKYGKLKDEVEDEVKYGKLKDEVKDEVKEKDNVEEISIKEKDNVYEKDVKKFKETEILNKFDNFKNKPLVLLNQSAEEENINNTFELIPGLYEDLEDELSIGIIPGLTSSLHEVDVKEEDVKEEDVMKVRNEIFNSNIYIPENPKIFNVNILISPIYLYLPLQCNICGLRYNNYEDLTIHIDDHRRKEQSLKNFDGSYSIGVVMRREFFNNKKIKSITKKMNIKLPTIKKKKLIWNGDSPKCFICHKYIKKVYDLECENWILEDAYKMNNSSEHAHDQCVS